MLLRTKVAHAAIVMTGLFAMTACGSRTDAGSPVAEPAGQQTTSAPSSSAERTIEVDVPDLPVTAAPLVAKTQGRVEVFSGPSDQPVEASPDTGQGGDNLELVATNSDRIGIYVADGQGRTLYRFDKDSASPPKATCDGDCAKTWPPLLIKSPGKIYPTGVDPRLVGYVERADGTCQVTVAGWPVYYFSKDTAAGDTKGQGVGGTWFAVGPAGEKTRAVA